MINKHTPLLELIDISKTYDSTIALQEINITFSKGIVTSIYGPNGAGKSTLIKIICGEERQDEGFVFLKGNKTVFKNYKDALNAGISYVPQDFGLLNNLSVIENIAIAQNQISNNYIYSKIKVEQFVGKAKKFDLPFPETDILVGNLSAYDQQLLATHKALFFNSEIIIFDESTTNINKEGFEEFKKVITRLKKEGKTIIFISHKLDEVFDISDDIVILKNGKIIEKISIDKANKIDIIDLFISDKTTKEAHIKNEKSNLCSIFIEINKYEGFDIDINKGEITLIDAGDTSLNQEIGYKIFENLKNTRDLKIGIIPASREEEAIFQNLSVKDNLLINVVNQKEFWKEKRCNNSINQIAKDLKLQYRDWNQNIGELSGGNKQKIVFGRWILSGFDILILIEPTSGIDIETKGIIHNKIIELKNKGKSFILITSDEGEQEMLQTRKLNINQKNELIC